MFELVARLLEFQKGEYQGNAYATVKLRSKDTANGAILKYKVDVKTVPDLDEYLDQELTFVVDIQRGQGDTASLRVVRVVLPD